jgi:hypothetical protein
LIGLIEFVLSAHMIGCVLFWLIGKLSDVSGYAEVDDVLRFDGLLCVFDVYDCGHDVL